MSMKITRGVSEYFYGIAYREKDSDIWKVVIPDAENAIACGPAEAIARLANDVLCEKASAWKEVPKKSTYQEIETILKTEYSEYELKWIILVTLCETQVKRLEGL